MRSTRQPQPANDTSRTSHRRVFTRQALLFMVIVGVAGLHTACMGLGSEEGTLFDANFETAQLALADGRIHDARAHFVTVPEHSPMYSQAMLGEVVCRLLLLPEHPGSTLVLLSLGADSSRLPVDAEKMLYSRQGILQLLAQGATTELVEERFFESMPWSREALEAGPGTLFAPLDPELTLDGLRPGLLLLDEELEQLGALLDALLARGLDVYVLPVGTLALTVEYRLRSSEVHALKGVLASLRSVLQLVLAYDYPIALRPLLSGLGSDERELTAVDIVQLLNDGIGLFFSPQKGEHLAISRAQALRAIRAFVDALEAGRVEEEAGQTGLISWLEIDNQDFDALRTLLWELDQAFSGESVVLSASEPKVRFDASPLFEGLLRQVETPLFVVAVALCGCSDEPCFCDDEEYVELDEAAFDAWLVTPLFAPESEFQMTSFPSDGGLCVFEPLAEEVRQTYRF